MELAKIENLLEAYQSLFSGLKLAQEEVLQLEINLPRTSGISRAWWYSIAASITVVIGVASFIYSGPQITQEEKEALAAFNKTKETMLLLSSNFNKGTDELAVIDQFTEAKNKILK